MSKTRVYLEGGRFHGRQCKYPKGSELVLGGVVYRKTTKSFNDSLLGLMEVWKSVSYCCSGGEQW